MLKQYHRDASKKAMLQSLCLLFACAFLSDAVLQSYLVRVGARGELGVGLRSSAAFGQTTSSPTPVSPQRQQGALSRKYAAFRASYIRGVTYQPHLKLDEQRQVVEVDLVVLLQLTDQVSGLVLDAPAVTLSSGTINGKALDASALSEPQGTGFLRLPKSLLKKGRNRLAFIYRLPMKSLQVSPGVFGVLPQPFGLHRLIMSFDQPSLKAVFKVKLSTSEKSTQVLSYASVEPEFAQKELHWVFPASPILSPHSMSLLWGSMLSLRKTQAVPEVSIWRAERPSVAERPSFAKKHSFAATPSLTGEPPVVAARAKGGAVPTSWLQDSRRVSELSDLIGAFEERLAFRYPFKQLQVLALPGQSDEVYSAAGLVVVRGSHGLVSPNHQAQPAQRRFRRGLATAVAQAWFGHLVGPEWWSDAHAIHALSTQLADLYLQTAEADRRAYRLDQLVHEQFPAIYADAFAPVQAQFGPVPVVGHDWQWADVVHAKTHLVLNQLKDRLGTGRYLQKMRQVLTLQQRKPTSSSRLYDLLIDAQPGGSADAEPSDEGNSSRRMSWRARWLQPAYLAHVRLQARCHSQQGEASKLDQISLYQQAWTSRFATNKFAARSQSAPAGKDEVAAPQSGHYLAHVVAWLTLDTQGHRVKRTLTEVPALAGPVIMPAWDAGEVCPAALLPDIWESGYGFYEGFGIERLLVLNTPTLSEEHRLMAWHTAWMWVLSGRRPAVWFLQRLEQLYRILPADTLLSDMPHVAAFLEARVMELELWGVFASKSPMAKSFPKIIASRSSQAQLQSPEEGEKGQKTETQDTRAKTTGTQPKRAAASPAAAAERGLEFLRSLEQGSVANQEDAPGTRLVRPSDLKRHLAALMLNCSSGALDIELQRTAKQLDHKVGRGALARLARSYRYCRKTFADTAQSAQSAVTPPAKRQSTKTP